MFARALVYCGCQGVATISSLIPFALVCQPSVFFTYLSYQLLYLSLVSTIATDPQTYIPFPDLWAVSSLCYPRWFPDDSGQTQSQRHQIHMIRRLHTHFPAHVITKRVNNSLISTLANANVPILNIKNSRTFVTWTFTTCFIKASSPTRYKMHCSRLIPCWHRTKLVPDFSSRKVV